jgi:predicted dehydrogenase
MSHFKIGIIGYGHIAEVHIENLLKFPIINVAAIFSRTNKKIQISSEIPFYTDYKKMISEIDLDAVIISTPTYTHHEIACLCAEQGINIFLEKPMANTLENCDIILDSVKENKVRLFIAHVLRFWPSYGSVQKYIDEDRLNLGDIINIEGKRLTTFPWSKWFADQQKSGGVILDLSIHDIDYALWLMGKPVSVSCTGKKINKYNMDVYGEGLIKINFENDKIAKCEGSWAKPEDFQFYTYTKIQGSNDFIEFDGVQIYNNEKWNIQNQYNSEDGYYNQIQHFLEICLYKKAKFLVSGIDGRLAVKVCLAAIKSAEEKGKEIFLDEVE